MRDNRDMFYSNYQAGGFQDPNFIQGMPLQQMQQPSGYNINSNYQAYGLNIMPLNNQSNNTNNNYLEN